MNRRIWLRVVPIAIAALVIAYQFASAPKYVNPETGRSARLGLSPQQEQALGLQGYQQVLASSEVVESGPELELVKRVASRLAAATGAAGASFQWSVALVRDPQLNAFCLPGGKICVYTGILPVTGGDEGLATVLGHEMAHATSHHGAERVFQQNAMQTAMIGVQGSLSDLDYGQRQALMGLLGAGAKFGVMLPFSREHESEADHVGLLYMARAGYDPRQAIAFWKRMSEHGGDQPPEYMSTHPLHATRIRQLEELMPEAVAEYERAAAH
jgi:predicted Zn-dependent protease